MSVYFTFNESSYHKYDFVPCNQPVMEICHRLQLGWAQSIHKHQTSYLGGMLYANNNPYLMHGLNFNTPLS